MKFIKILFLFMVLAFSSCNNHERLYKNLSIDKEFEPEYLVYDIDEISDEEKAKLKNCTFVINGEDEFPQEELMGLEKLKESNIDFKKYTLLLCYYRLPGIVAGHVFLLTKDLKNDSFIFTMAFRLDRENEEYDNLFTYYRTAVLVSKIPSGTDIEFRISH